VSSGKPGRLSLEKNLSSQISCYCRCNWDTDIASAFFTNLRQIFTSQQ